GGDQDDVILIPLSTAKKKGLGASQASPRAVNTISIKIRRGADMAEAEVQTRTLLRQRHRLQPHQDDDFSLRNLTEVLQTQERASQVMTYLLAAIASVSLVVGGIGIMNIMLVSVTERTREIGLRMAVGARGRDILLQFLVEAVTLSLLGAAVGAVALVLGATAGIKVIRAGTPADGKHYGHVFVIMMENTGYRSLIGNPNAPWINRAVATYGVATSYYGVAHPSQPNYIAAT